MKPPQYFFSDQNQSNNSHQQYKNPNQQYNYTYQKPRQESEDHKYILTWCEAYGGLNYGWGFGSTKFAEAGCSESKCFLTSKLTFKIN